MGIQIASALSTGILTLAGAPALAQGSPPAPVAGAAAPLNAADVLVISAGAILWAALACKLLGFGTNY